MSAIAGQIMGVISFVAALIVYLLHPIKRAKKFVQRIDSLENELQQIRAIVIINYYEDVKNGQHKTQLQRQKVVVCGEQYLAKGGNGYVKMCVTQITEGNIEVSENA